MRQQSNVAEEEAGHEDPRVIEIIEDLIDRIRNILDLFEGIVHEVYQLAMALADIFYELKDLLGFGRQEEEAQPAAM